jgi:transcriptional regulator with XRE-family HTH domain
MPAAVTNQQVSNWERGVNKPSDRHLEALAAALDVDVAYFVAAELDEPMPDLDDILTSSERIERLEAKLDAQSDLIRQLLERLDAAS